MYEEHVLYMSDYLESTVLSYSMASQWFENLITPEWWSDTWLSKGLSNYMQKIAAMHFFPKQDVIDTKLAAQGNEVFRLECLNGISNSLWKNVTDKNAISQETKFPFDITHFKSSVILQMIHYILGNETFWNALSIFLKENAYGNVNENQFWRYVDEAQNSTRHERTDLKKMKTWTHLEGMPIVSVERNYLDNTATFSQQSCIAVNKESDLWNIPIFSRTLRLNAEVIWLSERNRTISNMPPKDQWILVNGENNVYSIVNYDKQNWRHLANQFLNNHKVFSPVERIKILSDANKLYRLEYPEVTVDLLLDLYLYFHKESVWEIMLNLKDTFLWDSIALMRFGTFTEKWKDFIKYIFGPLYDKLYQEIREDDFDRIIYGSTYGPRLFYLLADFEHPTCYHEAMRRFENWRIVTTSQDLYIDRFIEQEILCIASRYENNSEFIYNEYLKHSYSHHLLTTLWCNSNVSIIATLLEENHLEATLWLLKSIYYVASSEKLLTLLLQYVDQNLEKYSEKQETFQYMIYLLDILSETSISLNKTLRIIEKHLPKIDGEPEEQLNIWIEKVKKKLPKMETDTRNIENWLRDEPWKKI